MCDDRPDGTSVACEDVSFVPIAPGGKSAKVLIRFKRFPDALKRAAKLVISTNDPALPHFDLMFVAVPGHPQIQLSPAELDFGTVQTGLNAVKAADVLNVGDGLLHVSSVDLSQVDSAFQIALSGDKDPPMALELPFDITAGSGLQLQVVFAPTDDKPHFGWVTLKTNDVTLSQNGVGVKLLKIQANTVVPCLMVQPGDPHFGTVHVGDVVENEVLLVNCGSAEVCVADVALDPPSGGPFSLE